MAEILVRAIMADAGGLAADAVENSFAFASATPAGATAAVLDFYNGANAGGSPVSWWIGNSRSRTLGGLTLEAVVIDGHLDGNGLPSPALITPETLGPSAGNNLPDQVCAVLSYHAIVTALPEHGGIVTRPTTEEAQDMGAPATYGAHSRPRASLRGRIFIGPLSSSAVQLVNGDLDVGAINDFRTAAARLMGNASAWSIWSKTYSTLTVISGGWVTNEPGTQRRRRDKNVTRVVWP
jgi:hypothetical protein